MNLKLYQKKETLKFHQHSPSNLQNFGRNILYPNELSWNFIQPEDEREKKVKEFFIKTRKPRKNQSRRGWAWSHKNWELKIEPKKETEEKNLLNFPAPIDCELSVDCVLFEHQSWVSAEKIISHWKYLIYFGREQTTEKN